MKSWIQSVLSRQRPLRTYAQSGEDILAHNLLCGHLRIARPVYVDIGAHDPVRLSNTYLFYKLGCRGLLIEPDPDCAKKLASKRPDDTLLTAGISADSETGTATLYRLNQPTLNTFSLVDAQDACRQGPYRIIEELAVPVLPINDAIDKHLGIRPNFLSIDAEGLDLAILKQLDLSRFEPEVICIESADFSESNIGPLRQDVFELMDKLGYFLHSSTYLNALFVSRRAWSTHIGDPPTITLHPQAARASTPLTTPNSQAA